MGISDEISVGSWLEIIVAVGVTFSCFVGMFIGTFTGISIGFSVIIDAVLDAGASCGPSVGTGIDTFLGISVSISVMKPLQCDGRSGSEEMGFSISIRNLYAFSMDQRSFVPTT